MIKNKRAALLGLVILLLCVTALSLTFGQIPVPVKNTLAVVCHQIGLPCFTESDFTQEQMAVIWFIRMPRMVVGVLVGGALGMSGAVMQGIFSNPLADPGIIGISAGAATGAVLAIATGFAAHSMFTMPAFAFCGNGGIFQGNFRKIPVFRKTRIAGISRGDDGTGLFSDI